MLLAWDGRGTLYRQRFAILGNDSLINSQSGDLSGWPADCRSRASEGKSNNPERSLEGIGVLCAGRVYWILELLGLLDHSVV